MLRLVTGFHAVGQELPDVACGFHFTGNLACFTGWLTGLIPLNITAYDGLHGHPYGIFLYPNPFSIGLLNLIVLALPWRWQATYRTEP